MNSIACPRCGEDRQLQTHQMAYNTGTSQGSLRGYAIGTSTSTSLSVHDVSGRVSQQTNLAGQTAPPDPPMSIVSLCLLGFLGWFAGTLVFDFIHWLIAGALFFPLSSLVVAFKLAWFLLGLPALAVLSYRWRKNKNESYQQAISDWHRRWVCLRCGTSFYE